MTTGGIYRDVASSEERPPRVAREGRAYIAVIGIDRYRTWNRLYNAVSDAKGALKLFAGLGFELAAPALFDDNATGDALRRLVVDDLSGLDEQDSLVLFFAGHGHTVERSYGGASVRDGYLIPADGDRPGGRAATWIRLESWLTEITRIPVQHILVILDACHSGLALGPILQWRSRGMENARREPLEQLRVRRSRRIITSALDDQLAMDGGPVPGHSLFTGCLIEAMTGGLVASAGHQIVTGSEIGHHVQRRVSEYPGSAQTPDFGALELDDRGELLVHLRRPDPARPLADSPAVRPARDRTAMSGSTTSMAGPASRRRTGVVLTTGVVLAGAVAGIVAVTRTPDPPAAPAGSPPPVAPSAVPSPPVATGTPPVAAPAAPVAERRAVDPVPPDAGAASAADAEPSAPARRLTPEGIVATVRGEYAAELRRCYERHAKTSHDASHKLVVTLHVAATGRVVDHQTDPPIPGCEVFKNMRFAADGAVDDPPRQVTAEVAFDYPSTPPRSGVVAPARASHSCSPGKVWKSSESACVVLPDKKECPPIKDRVISPFEEDPCRQ